jgi:hypothetical protein
MRMHLLFPLLVLITTSSGSPALAQDTCRDRYPNIWQLLSKWDCEKEGQLREKKIKEEEEREARARPCIAAELPRLESELRHARELIKADMSLDEVQIVLNRHFGKRGSVVVSDNNIKEKVYVNFFSPNCASSFRFLINVNADHTGKLINYMVWAQNSPRGYPEGSVSELSLNFEQQRRQAQLKADLEAKRIEDIKKKDELAVREAEITRRTKEAFQGIYLEEHKLECRLAWSCNLYEIRAAVSNRSTETLTVIEIGWVFVPRGSSCPTLMSKRSTNTQLVRPGDTTWLSIIGFDGPNNMNYNFCITLESIKIQ